MSEPVYKVFVAALPGSHDGVAHHALDADAVQARLTDAGHQPVATPAEADLILLFEENSFKTHRYIPQLLQQPILRDHAEKCFAVNFDDHPFAFLPGIYASMPSDRFDADFMRAGPYVGEYNAWVAKSSTLREQTTAKYFYSFRGSRSHPLRDRLLAMSHPADASVEASAGWFNHDDSQKSGYVQEILESNFVLCPRGQGSTSIRLFETMQLGRAAVVISDAWVPPHGPDWARCIVRIEESELAGLPQTLRARAGESAATGLAARAAWEQYFSPVGRVKFLVDAAADLLHSSHGRPRDFAAAQARWMSAAFWRENNWTLQQRLRNKAGRVWRRLRKG